jgi:hypothetical protein
VYLIRAKVSIPGKPVLLSPVTITMLPLDCSKAVAVKVVAVTENCGYTPACAEGCVQSAGLGLCEVSAKRQANC